MLLPSVRQHLKKIGVKNKDMPRHLNFIYETLKVNPNLNISRYKVTSTGETKQG